MENTLREIRQQKGKVLFDMAKATDLHVSTIHRIEHGQLPQSFERIEVLAQCYELPVAEFVAAVYAAYRKQRLEPVNTVATPTTVGATSASV